MKKIVLMLSIILSYQAHAGMLQAIAKDRLTALDKIRADDKKTLKAMKNPNENKTLLQRNQAVRYINAQKDSIATFGEDTLSEDYGYCVKAFNMAVNSWQARASAVGSASAFSASSAASMEKQYLDARKGCDALVKKFN